MQNEKTASYAVVTYCEDAVIYYFHTAEAEWMQIGKAKRIPSKNVQNGCRMKKQHPTL